MPIAMVDVIIKPKNYAVDRVLRFFRSEGELLRRTVKFYLSNADLGGTGERAYASEKKDKKATQFVVTENSTIHDAGNPWKKYVRCNHPDVVCTLSDSGKGNGNLKEISFKYRVGSAPETTAIYFLLYDDPYHTSLHEVWRVFIHSLHRLDVNCILGQTNQSSLVIRGSSFSRTVQCYSNLPDELLVTAGTPFILTANSLNEIGMLMRPKYETIRDIIINVVDVDDQSLVSSWLVVSHCSLPTITKSFEISVPRAKAVNKRVSYTNPYTTKRVFRLKTNAEHLVQFREGNMLQLAGGASKYIPLRLLPNTSGTWADILIFLNDDFDKIEESPTTTPNSNRLDRPLSHSLLQTRLTLSSPPAQSVSTTPTLALTPRLCPRRTVSPWVGKSGGVPDTRQRSCMGGLGVGGGVGRGVSVVNGGSGRGVGNGVSAGDIGAELVFVNEMSLALVTANEKVVQLVSINAKNQTVGGDFNVNWPGFLTDKKTLFIHVPSSASFGSLLPSPSSSGFGFRESVVAVLELAEDVLGVDSLVVCLDKDREDLGEFYLCLT
ncbi:hypothetical protein HK100_006655 [Physocladia obscura]|uniref:Uncharacterized protein n=1 Tax=Physocladia obscura TaxID=109957 RepID=A0AAD5SQ61_9FUNG|nr:hypothetical protein HK100_006655 [Physocladia obscura]